MNIYPILVFIHVLGGVLLLAALAVEAVALAGLRRAETPQEAQAAMRMLAIPARLGPLGMLPMLGAGIWMMVRWWGPQPWIQTALVAVIAMGVLGGAVTGRRVRRLRTALSAETSAGVSPASRSLRSSRALTTSLHLRVAIAVGILGLMTLKPGMSLSLVILAGALAAGLLTAFRLTRRSTSTSQTPLEWKGARS